MSFWCDQSCDYYDTKKEAEEACEKFFDLWDLEMYADVDTSKILEELNRLGSPLFEEYYNEAIKQFFEDNITEIEDE